MNTLVIISYSILILLCIWSIWWIWNPRVLTRVKVLKKAKKILISDQGCICVSVQEVLRRHGFKGMAFSEVLEIFPLLTFETAKEKGFNPKEPTPNNAPIGQNVEKEMEKTNLLIVLTN